MPAIHLLKLDKHMNRIYEPNHNKMQKSNRRDLLERRYFSLLKRIARTFVRRRSQWSIGIYTGKSHLSLFPPDNLNNPVLTAKDVTDVPAHFVADPFMICENGTWYMFFEVLNALTLKGEIGLATSDDGFNWNYQAIILDEPFHLSYPYVFKVDDEYYMIPESYEANAIRLYKAVDFPRKWHFVKTLLDGSDYVDNSIFNFHDKWWIFTTSPKGNVLDLYYADDLMGNWIKHPQSPLINGNFNISRPGGRVVVSDEKIFRYTQDVDGFYGNQVRAFEITNLTTTNYEEKQIVDNPIIKASGYGWNKTGMHTIDPHQLDDGKWIACVDGYQIIFVFGMEHQKQIKIMTKANATK
ncbi:glycoside hydrolase family 32 protein [Nostoc sp. NZL]|nr:glycoside hydrolase family 32 protein [Nostoc sp. NZL]